MSERLTVPNADFPDRQTYETQIPPRQTDPNSLGHVALLLAAGVIGSPAEAVSPAAAMLPPEITMGLITATEAGESLKGEKTVANR